MARMLNADEETEVRFLREHYFFTVDELAEMFRVRDTYIRRALGLEEVKEGLTEETVGRIKRLWEKGIAQGTIAVLTDTSRENVSRIVNGKRWKHVEASVDAS